MACPDECAGVGFDACTLAASFRKEPQTLGPAVCGDLDASGNVVIGPCGAELCVVHTPIDPCDYRTSFAINAQATIDAARRNVHTFGLRPYRVFLVWVRRNRRQEFEEYRRQELIPVKVSPLTDVDLELRSVGLDQVGGIRLTKISPNQVDDRDLRGLVADAPIANDEEFFYEVVRTPRCAQDQPQRERFTIGSTPYYNATRFQWEVDIVAQQTARKPDGTDDTFEPARGTKKRRLEILRR